MTIPAVLSRLGLGWLFVGLPWAIAAIPYHDGPLPGKTGGFGEDTCRHCHFDNPMNARGGALRLEGVPPVYVPGRAYIIQVVLRRARVTRGGFELAARFETGPEAGRQAGSFDAFTPGTRIVLASGGDTQYAQHTDAGSIVLHEEGRWAVSWTAPVLASGPVVFHVAANASNNDASPLGDFIYTTSVTSRAR